MAVHCVNIKNKQVIDLAKELNLHPAVAAAKIAIWQESNGLNKFPSVEDLTNKNIKLIRKLILIKVRSFNNIYKN